MSIKKRYIKKRYIKKRSIKKRSTKRSAKKRSSIKKRSTKRSAKKRSSIKKRSIKIYDTGKVDKVDKIDEVAIEDYFKDWKKIDNKGQHNCGIFINSKKNDRILKCEQTHLKSECESVSDYLINTYFSNINSLISKSGKKIFPEIYDVKYILKDSYIYIYTEMEKLDGDISSYFLDKISESVIEDFDISSYFSDKISESVIKDVRDHIIYIFNLQQNSTGGKKIESRDLKKIKDLTFDTDIIPTDINCSILELDKLLKDTELTEKIYSDFISKYSSKLQTKLKEINKKLKNLDADLKAQGFSYQDRKFDNFGYKIKDDKDIDMMYILDWTSGLQETQRDPTYELKFYGINGQYNLYNLLRKINATKSVCYADNGKPIITEEEFDCKFLKSEINEIFKKKYELIPEDFDWNG